MLFVNSAIVSLRKVGAGCVNGPTVPPPEPVAGPPVPAAPLPGPPGDAPGALTVPTHPAATSAVTATLTRATFAKTLVKAHLRLRSATTSPHSPRVVRRRGTLLRGKESPYAPAALP